MTATVFSVFNSFVFGSTLAFFIIQPGIAIGALAGFNLALAICWYYIATELS